MNFAHLFAGANTAAGFWSFYNYLVDDKLRRSYILKGGPGTGKSTLLATLAKALSGRYQVDIYHCSADVESLDGIFVHQLDVTVVDGTAPHVVDPRLPGAVQQLVDLGACWDAAPLMKQREKITRLADDIGAAYRSAYRWLAAAEAVDCARWPRHTGQQPEALADAGEIITLLPHHGAGRARKAFATAITAEGHVSYLTRLAALSDTNIYLIGCRLYNGTVLQAVATYLENNGVGAVHCYCALQPRRLEHIFIPGQLGIWSVNRHHRIRQQGELVFGSPPAEPQAELVDDLLGKGMAELAHAKKLHKKLESIYTPHVNFRQVETVGQQLLDEILALDEQTRP